MIGILYISSTSIENLERKKLQNWAYGLIVLVLGTIVLKEGSFLFVPLVWGIFFSFTLYPIANWLELKRIPRGVAIVLSILLFTVFVVGVFYLLLNQMIGLIKEIPEIGENLKSKLGDYFEQINTLFGGGIIAESQSTEIWSYLSPENLNRTLFATGKSLTLGGIIPLYVFLLMYYKDFFAEFLAKVSKGPSDKVLSWVGQSGYVIQSYLAGMFKVTIIVGLLAGLFFYFLGIEYFILFGAFIAIMNLIPYVGVFISSFFAILYVFLTSDSYTEPILTFGVLWGIQLLENNLITPLVVGSQVKVNALAVVLAILLGGWLWGVSGMVLFIPLVGVLKLTLERTQGMEAYAYLLGDDVPVTEANENYLKILKRKFKKTKD